jgi:hypothetical protein
MFALSNRYGVNRYGKHSHVHLGHPVDYAVVVEDMRYLCGRETWTMKCLLTRVACFIRCSTNGTYINETLIGKGNERTLTHGDNLSLVMPISNRPDGTTPAAHGDRPMHPFLRFSASSFPNGRSDF